MHVIYQADNLFDAHLVKHALEDAGIPAFVFGESLLGGMGELPLFGVLRVCVPDLARPEAEQIVAELDFGGPSEDQGQVQEERLPTPGSAAAPTLEPAGSGPMLGPDQSAGLLPA